MIKIPDLQVLPLTLDRWDDLVSLFGPRGACSGCWCMYWLLKNKDFEELKGEKTRQLLLEMVQKGTIPGLLAYDGDKAVGWCAVGPREVFSRLERSRVLKRVDGQTVWSIVCFYVRTGYRRKGVTSTLIKAAIEFARREGGKIIEGYPILPKTEQVPPIFAYSGIYSTFARCGFVEVERNSPTRSIMRYTMTDQFPPTN